MPFLFIVLPAKMPNYRCNTLAQNWQEIFSPDSPQARETFLELIARYREPKRFYHTLTHLQQVLATIETLYFQENRNDATLKLKTVRLAAWFHDAIYDPQRSDNEEKSADYAAEKLAQLAVSDAEIDRVRTAILCTKTHQARDLCSQLLLDADLAILGAPPTAYGDYARAIRKEYARIGDRDYAIGRTRVLSGFLARSRIYHTPALFVELEAQARINLKAEIAEAMTALQ